MFSLKFNRAESGHYVHVKNVFAVRCRILGWGTKITTAEWKIIRGVKSIKLVMNLIILNYWCCIRSVTANVNK